MAFDGDKSGVFLGPGFAFLIGFELEPDPVGGRQLVTYAICNTAIGSNAFRSVETGSATKAGNRM